MVPPSRGFIPALMTGVTVNPDDPLRFDFIIDTGNTGLDVGAQNFEPLRKESEKLIKYFLAALTVPEDELWVNLSPYEQDRMVAPGLGKTEMGRDMLAQDYLLKQLTASLMYPEKELGKKFWDRVYKKAKEQFGTTEIPVNTFNKVWIVPEEAVVYERGTSAFVVKSRLAVMLETDYLAMNSNVGNRHAYSLQDDNQNTTVSTEIIREIILPEIEKEVNEGETFADLRQIYHSLILATWYKQRLKESLLGKVYVNQNKTKGINPDDPAVNQKIYDRYIASFEKGVYNYIKEDVDPATQQVVPRKYFSGGVNTYNPRPGKGWLSRMIAAAALTGFLLAGSPASVQAEVSDALAGVGTKFGVTTQLVENASGDAENTSAIVVNKGIAPEPLLLAQDGAVYPESFGAATEGGLAQDRRASSPVGSQETPAWPSKSPDKTNVELESAIRKALLLMELVLHKINSDIRTTGKTKKDSLLGLLSILRKLTSNDALFDGAVQKAENTFGKPSDESSFHEWMFFVRRVLFNLNVSLFVKHGWLIDIGHDEQQQLRARRAIVKHFEILNDGEQPVILVQTDSDDRTVAGHRILYDSVGSFIDPAVIILDELTDQEIDEVYQGYLDFAQNESNKEFSPSTTKIVGQIANVNKKTFRDIYREQLLSEEWGHYQEFQEREKLQQGSTNIVNAEQLQRHLDIAFPETSRHPVIKAIRNILNMYLTFHKKQEHPIAEEMILVITEASAEARRLYFAPSYAHFLVALATTTENIFSPNDIQRESARTALYPLEKILKGGSGLKNDNELENFSQEFNSFLALPEIAKLTPPELYEKFKDWRGGGSRPTSSPVTSNRQQATRDEVGGIDLNPALLDLQIRRDGNGVALPLSQQPIETMRIDGFVPIIINITPIPDLLLLLGLEKPGDKKHPLSSTGGDKPAHSAPLVSVNSRRERFYCRFQDCPIPSLKDV